MKNFRLVFTAALALFFFACQKSNTSKELNASKHDSVDLATLNPDKSKNIGLRTSCYMNNYMYYEPTLHYYYGTPFDGGGMMRCYGISYQIICSDGRPLPVRDGDPVFSDQVTIQYGVLQLAPGSTSGGQFVTSQMELNIPSQDTLRNSIVRFQAAWNKYMTDLSTDTAPDIYKYIPANIGGVRITTGRLIRSTLSPTTFAVAPSCYPYPPKCSLPI